MALEYDYDISELRYKLFITSSLVIAKLLPRENFLLQLCQRNSLQPTAFLIDSSFCLFRLKDEAKFNN